MKKHRKPPPVVDDDPDAVPSFLLVRNRRPLTQAQQDRVVEIAKTLPLTFEQQQAKHADLREAKRQEKIAKLKVRVARAKDKKRLPDRIAIALKDRSMDRMTLSRHKRIMSEMPTKEMRLIFAQQWVRSEGENYFYPAVVHGLVSAPGPTVRFGTGDHAPTEEMAMAKKTKKAKTKKTKKAGNGTVRQLERPNGKVDDFVPVRAGTARAAVVRMGAKGDQTVAQIASRIGKDRGTVLTHLFLLNRDCAIGYKIDETQRVSLTFPGSKTVDDAIKEKAAAAAE